MTNDNEPVPGPARRSTTDPVGGWVPIEPGAELAVDLDLADLIQNYGADGSDPKSIERARGVRERVRERSSQHGRAIIEALDWQIRYLDLAGSQEHAGRTLNAARWSETEVAALRAQVAEQVAKGHSQNAALEHVAKRTASKRKPGETMTAKALKSLLQRRRAKA